MKKCSKCKEDKELDQFSIYKKSKDGLKTWCKLCVKDYNLLYRNSHKEERLIYNEFNKDNIQLYNKNYLRNYYKENKDLCQNRMSEYYTENIDYFKDYYILNKDHINSYTLKYSKENKDKWYKHHRKYIKKRLKTDILFRLQSNIRSNISSSIKRMGYTKNLSSKLILGCSFEEFKLYIESLFEPWMNWNNYGNPKDGILEINKTWDLDHIIPASKAKNKEEIYKLNHYTNFQPLCSYVNRCVKSNKEIC